MIKVAVDVETSGFKPYWNDVITIGLVVYDDEADEFTPIATFYDKARPWTPSTWNEGSTNAHGFLLDDTLHWQDPRDLCIKTLHFLKPFFKNKYLPFVYHAEGNFDFLHMQSLFLKGELQFSFYKVFSEGYTHSTLIEAREQGYEGNALSKWANRLNREFNHHNALDDALMCAALDCFLKKRVMNALEEITTESAPVEILSLTTLKPVRKRK